jgi:LysR family transcriptional regulator, glycine cleavage system transcriptional activator
MKSTMPPLNALRAFEAAARHLSFTRAAEELHVTPAALSHQIKGLEEFLEVKLFVRKTRSIELTDAGRTLYPGLHIGFGELRQAVASLDRIRNDRVLVISAAPGFTAKWLTPRLYRFLAENPEIDARISATPHVVDFERDGIDVAIRNTTIDSITDPELVAERLVDIAMLPVVSPRYLEQFGELKDPQDLTRASLIYDESLSDRIKILTWKDWLEKAGVEGVDLRRGLRFNSADHAVDAAVEGAGVLLSYYTIAYEDLRLGRLVSPFGLQLTADRAFYFVCRKVDENRPKVAAFRDWLRRERDIMMANPVCPNDPEALSSPEPASAPKKAARRARSK